MILLVYYHSNNMAEVKKEAENLEPKPVEKVEEILKDDADKVIPVKRKTFHVCLLVDRFG